MWGGYQKWVSQARNALVRNLMNQSASGVCVPAPERTKSLPDFSSFPVYTGDKGQKATLWFSDFQTYCSNSQVDPLKYVGLKMSHSTPSEAVISPREVLSNLTKKCGAAGFTLTRVSEEMIRHFEKVVFDKSHHARDLLMDGSYKQKSDEAFVKYQARFETIITDAPEMSEVDRISWFLHGLNAAMRPMCLIQPVTGLPWSKYDDLVQFTFGQEQRLLATVKSQRQEPQVPAVQAPSRLAASTPKRARDDDALYLSSDPHFRSKSFRRACWKHRLCNICGESLHSNRECGEVNNDLLRVLDKPPGWYHMQNLSVPSLS